MSAATPAPGGSQQSCTLCNDFLREADTSQRLFLIVLNNKLPQLTAKLWKKAQFRICADGGANRLFDDLPRMLPEQDAAEVRRQHLPQVICGDLDSLRPDVRQFYEGLGAACHDLSSDQDSTDFEKCLRVTVEEMARHQVGSAGTSGAGTGPDVGGGNVLVILGAMGGRMDHVLSHLNVLYAHPNLPLVLIGDGNAVRLLKRGVTLVKVTPEEEGPYCGIVPLSGPATVSSKGLKWDMGTPAHGSFADAWKPVWGRVTHSATVGCRRQVMSFMLGRVGAASALEFVEAAACELTVRIGVVQSAVAGLYSNGSAYGLDNGCAE